MPTKRVPRYREHIGRISLEAVRLFAKLEATPKKLRKSKEFRDGERRLADLLDLTTEWWGGTCVLDCHRHNPFRPWQASCKYWDKCQAVREQLLAMCAQGA
jgi:hypothetical protein